MPSSAIDPRINALVERNGWRVHKVSDAGGGRGVFSDVWRVELSGPAAPQSVVAKLSTTGPNGEAARASGAYRREALAYQRILTSGAVRHPELLDTLDEGDDRWSFLITDLGQHRAVAQATGLDLDDALHVVSALSNLHRAFAAPERTDGLNVRRSAPATFDSVALERGLDALPHHVGPAEAQIFRTLLDRRSVLIEAFNAQSPTLCHGDPRADNLVFDETTGEAILFDWQQIAVQFGEADLSWLAATSMAPLDRAKSDQTLVARYASLTASDLSETWRRYRLGFLLPGLAVLLLVQREAPDERTATMVSNSIRRIATAVRELDVVGVADEI
ncbi:MAG: aminoglycoside phosphotransferase (APT) family kinase protein [Acidimicrobiales bacterium]|jgi:aminoglycoside phosphotransferase (APT) family kinase protein